MYHPISTEEVLRENAAYEARINEAEEALSRRGFPRTAIFRQPVVWGEHDQYQHVNNAHYIRWFESARMRWMERMSRTPVSYTHLTLPTIAAECRSRWSPYH